MRRRRATVPLVQYLVNWREAARCGEWAQHFSNASCSIIASGRKGCSAHYADHTVMKTQRNCAHNGCTSRNILTQTHQAATTTATSSFRWAWINQFSLWSNSSISSRRESQDEWKRDNYGTRSSCHISIKASKWTKVLILTSGLASSLGPFHGAIVVPSVTRCRCRCRRGHLCTGGTRQYR